MKNVWLKRIAIAVVLLALFSVIWLQWPSAYADSSEFTNVTYSGPEGQNLKGYLALPEGPGPHPTVLLIHEWWGLNQGMTVMADALAAEGYVVLAADAYRGKLTDSVPRALYLRSQFPSEQVQADLDAALDFLQSHEAVDKDRVASMGFCFGGGESLQLGLRQSENLAVTVIYYGAVVTDPGLLTPFTEGQAVLGVFAESQVRTYVTPSLVTSSLLSSSSITSFSVTPFSVTICSVT